jgi:hypothetical protein
MTIPGSASSMLMVAAAAAPPAGYQIERSLRFNSSDSAYLSRTFALTNRRTWTFSTWVKRSKLGTTQNIFQSSNESTADQYLVLNFDSSDRLFMGGGPTTYRLSTARFRDVSAWYHIVLTWDTTQATAADRVRLYVNGTQLTTFDSSTDPSQNFDGGINRAKRHNLGMEDFASGVNFLDAYLADIHFIDGQALTPSSFGEFDTNGVWQPIDASGLTYGTNGFHLPFSDNSTAAALGTDTSGNGNTWTVNNIVLYLTLVRSLSQASIGLNTSPPITTTLLPRQKQGLNTALHWMTCSLASMTAPVTVHPLFLVLPSLTRRVIFTTA